MKHGVLQAVQSAPSGGAAPALSDETPAEGPAKGSDDEGELTKLDSERV